MPKAYKLTFETFAKKKHEGSGDIVLFDELSSIKTFQLATFKNLPEAVGIGSTIYKMPKDTVSILQTNSRDKTGATETEVLKVRLDNPAPVVVPMSKQMVSLLSSMEKHSGYPLKVVFGKRKKGSLFLCHKEPLVLPLEARLKAYSELLDFAQRKKKLQILKRIPTDVGNVQLEFFENAPKPFCQGTPAYPGLAVGKNVEGAFPEIFAAETTSPADVSVMKSAKVMITGGGLISHAALLAASEGIPCVVGVSAKAIKAINNYLNEVKVVSVKTNKVSVDAYTGKIYLKELNVIEKESKVDEVMGTVLQHARDFMDMEVYANADTPDAISAAIQGGATGVGLLRTEHMYQDGVTDLSDYLMCALHNDIKMRRKKLQHLLISTRERFKNIFEVLNGHYVAIRLLDAPLNEFVKTFHEENPMMGLRGCRFGILFNDFYGMQVQAIAEGYKTAKADGPVGIMIPLVSEVGEIIVLKDFVKRVWKTCGLDPELLSFGAMIETPRACMIAAELAQLCDFFSYGSNDLTQFTFAFSRDDTTFLPNYSELGVLEYNPFQTLDARGVGKLIYLSAKMARKINPAIKLGLCGHHAGDPDSIRLVQSFGFNYVSCTKANISKAVLSMVQG